MSSSIYTKLAFTNLKNNRKTYIPYILTAILSVMMYYIINALSKNDRVADSNTLQFVLLYASKVMIVFSVIFLFYTNSFLIKRRKKEIGIYNIIGMGKSHIAKMLLVETFVTALVSIGMGIISGILFSKLMWLVLLKMLHYDVQMDFEVSAEAIVGTLGLFSVIFLLTLLYNLWQIKLANPVELLRGGKQGEKEPKTKWLMTIFGVGMIGYGYYVALTTESPLAAIQLFFVAVLCVILGTYALFVAGSVALLKILKKNKNFYYKANHFTPVSGMIYRMKQNAVGLANICILSTMVMVMVSTTISLYAGMDDILKTRFPREVSVEDQKPDKDKQAQISRIIKEETKKAGVTIKGENAYHYGDAVVIKKENKFTMASDGSMYPDIEDICEFYMIPLEDYNEMEDQKVSLDDNEVLIYNPDKDAEKMKEDTIQIEKDTYKIKKELDTMKVEKKNSSRLYEGYYVILKDSAKIKEYLYAGYERLKEENPNYESDIDICYKIEFDLKGNRENCNDAIKAMEKRIGEEIPDAVCQSRELSKESLYELYGGLLFIGIYLGAMFLMATVLIIYYKQISEGYDDKERYQIMQKVGMSKREVRRSIRSQVLIVFFLPLIVAVIHIAAAFKVITKLLAVLNLVNVKLFLGCTVVTVAVFAVFYAVIFVMTAREYYRIVN